MYFFDFRGGPARCIQRVIDVQHAAMYAVGRKKVPVVAAFGQAVLAVYLPGTA